MDQQPAVLYDDLPCSVAENPESVTLNIPIKRRKILIKKHSFNKTKWYSIVIISH